MARTVLTSSASRSNPAPRVAAVASRAIRGVIDGRLVSGCVLGASRFAVWVAVGDVEEGGACVVVGTGDAVRLPNSLSVVGRASQRPLAGIEVRQPVMVGAGAMRFERLVVERVRWWDPRPALVRTSLEALAAGVEELSRYVETLGDPLEAALVDGDLRETTAIAVARLGDGPGLTPYEDDVVSGALASMVLLGQALGGSASVRTRAFVRDVGGGVCPAAWRRTPALSATLLQHAVVGEVAAPVGVVLRALVGDGELEGAMGELLRVGHSSGAGLAKGVLMGARGALAMGRRS